MSLPWQIPLEGVRSLKTKEKTIEPTLHQYYCNLTVHENPIDELQTGLMCNIGMENRETASIQRLIACGMTISRLKLVGLEPDACTQLVQSIRQAAYNYSADLSYVYPLALIVDVHGPAVVTGDLKTDTQVEISKNQVIRLSNEDCFRDNGTADCLYINYQNMSDLASGDIIFIDTLAPGEKLQLSIMKVGEDSVECRVNVGGVIGPKMAVTISKVPEPKDSANQTSLKNDCDQMSETVKHFECMNEQVQWAVASDIDAILVPCTQSSSDVRLAKSLLSENGKHILVFASIETVRGTDYIDDILKEADGIYLDRNELSTDLPVEKIFIAQKMIISKCNNLGKPCICKSVLNEQVPTLCVNDIATLIIDGADVISLEFNFDSPLKKIKGTYDPYRMAEHCVAATAVICKEAENTLWRPRIYGNLELMENPLSEPSKAVCVSAVELAMRSRASVILCLTSSGRTARILSYTKPSCPIVAVTRTCHAGRQLRFWRGVRAVHYCETPKTNWNSEMEARILIAIDYCKAKLILRPGDAYVILNGSRRGVGYCDCIRLLYATSRSAVVVE